jgi:HEAT repeat protein
MRSGLGKHPQVAGWLVVGACVLISAAVTAGAPPTPGQATVSERVRDASNINLRGPQREQAIKSMANITAKEESDNSVVGALLNIAKADRDIFVRRQAIETLGDVELNITKDHKAKTAYLEPFVAILKTDSEKDPLLIKEAVLQTFSKTLVREELPDKNKAYPAIVDLAKSRADAPLRVKAIEAIGKFGGDDGLDVLSDLLNDGDPDVKIAGARALNDYLQSVANAKDVKINTVNKLADMLGERTFPVELKVAIIRASGRMVRDGNNGAKIRLQPLLLPIPEKGLPGLTGAQYDAVVLASIDALGMIGTADTVPPLVQAYKNYFNEKEPTKILDVPVRRAVIDALATVLQTQVDQKQPDNRVVKNVTDTLVMAMDKDPVPEIKTAAVYSARYLYPPQFKAEQREVLASLLGLLKDAEKNDELRNVILQALKAISGRDFGTDVRKWNEWFDKTYPPKK